AGYTKVAKVLQQNNVEVTNLTLLGANTIPDDCNLLIIAGPKDPLFSSELARIDKYLTEGGRMSILFNFLDVVPAQHPTGLEKLLTKWGVNVTTNIVKDTEHSASPEAYDVQVFNFLVKNPI